MKTGTSWGGPNGVSATCSANKQQPGEQRGITVAAAHAPGGAVPPSDALQCQAM